MSRLLRSLCAATVALSSALPALAQETVARKLTLKSESDGLPIAATYWPADPGKVTGGTENAAVVILLHGANGDRLVWEKKPTVFDKKPFAEALYNEGFAVVSVDLRGHGESPLPDGRPLRAADYQAMLGDLEAVKEFLMEEHAAKRLNINKLGIVAADDMVPVAMEYTSYDWKKPDYDDAPTPSQRTPRGRDVRALALLSPSPASGRLKAYPTVSLLRNPRANIATFVGVGADDPQDGGTAERIGKQLRIDPQKPEEGYFLQTYPARFRGVDLSGQPNLRTQLHVLNFLKKFLQELETPWVDRRSRLVR